MEKPIPKATLRDDAILFRAEIGKYCKRVNAMKTLLPNIIVTGIFGSNALEYDENPNNKFEPENNL